jgi:DNA-binding PadR family transcriptional regulator
MGKMKFSPSSLYLTLKFLETKNWSIAVWAACVKKNK